MKVTLAMLVLSVLAIGVLIGAAVTLPKAAPTPYSWVRLHCGTVQVIQDHGRTSTIGWGCTR